jgi:hypothetical protein
MLLLTFAMLTGFGQLAGQVQSAPSTRQPVVLVQRLYTQVVSLHPIGVTKGADMTTFAPYLSTALRHRIDLTAACEADWFRQHPESGMKPGFGWLELGLFSGDEEMAEPSAFDVEKTQTEKDGTVHVYLKLTHAESNERPWTWQVAAIVRREDGRYVVDDVIYLKDKNDPSDVWLSKILSNGCRGPRWVGEGNQR